MLVVADASPLNYLILIGEVSLLERLYGKIVIPFSVAAELRDMRAPSAVRGWMQSPPAWALIEQSALVPRFYRADLDAGETEAIEIALREPSSLLLIDELKGRSVAEQLSIQIIGTIGILQRGALQGFVDLPKALASLRGTNFRLAASIEKRALAQNRTP